MNKTKDICTNNNQTQCTEYAYFRIFELTGLYPCWYRGSGDKGYGLFTNAKNWGVHFRDPFIYLDINDIKEFKDYDVLIFGGCSSNKYGHVAVVEHASTTKLLVSDCNYIAPFTYNERYWTIQKSMSGCGNLIGVLRIDQKQTKTISDIAKEVISGKWGNYPERKQRLTQAGYNYTEIQKEVNYLMNKRKTNEELAQEVISGKWGNNPYRSFRLNAAGYNASEVQKIVNKLMSEK